MKRAQEITDLTFTQILPLIKPGLRERDLSAEIVYGLLKNGADKVSFDPVVVSGEKSSMPHGVPGDEKIKHGDFVTMDFGCIYGGYCSDMTRTVAVGHATDEMKKVYEIVLRAKKEGILAAGGGKPGSSIDAAARAVIDEAGYGEYFGHGFGHGLGIEIHEKPGASPSDLGVLPAGAVISAEPGIYLPGRFGVRIEDVIILTPDGCEDITHSSGELMIV
jgi:Xaa-Pro aminopeptidase